MKSLYVTVLSFYYMNILINTRSEFFKSDVNDNRTFSTPHLQNQAEISLD